MADLSLLSELELLASKWEQLGNQAADRYADAVEKDLPKVATIQLSKRNAYWQTAEELRTAVAQHLSPGLRVRYHYAAEWKIGVLLTRPSKDRPYWQVHRSGFGGYVDQVSVEPDIIRICIDDTTKEETA